MATRNTRTRSNSNAAPQAPEIPDLEVTSWEVQRARSTQRGDIYFTLVLNGISINNCRVVQLNDNREFISWPQYKGSNNQWYNVVYARLDDKTQKMILDEVYNQLDAEEE